MSASKENKTRQDLTADSQLDPKTAREAKQRKEEKRANLLYGAIAILFVIVAVASITWKSGIVQRKATAATVNGQNYSASEVQYYFKSTYQNFMSQYSSYVSYLGLDTSKDLKDQPCQMSEKSATWYDYFLDQALTQMSSVHALCDAAEADGFAWDDAMQSDLDSVWASMETAAKDYNDTYGTTYSSTDYLKAIFGPLMTKGIYMDQVKLGILAQAYSDKYLDGLNYSDADLTAAYEEDPNTYDVVDYESVRVNGAAAATQDAEGKSVEPTEAESAAAMEDAKAAADKLYAAYQSGESLSELADAEDKASYTDNKGGAYSDNVLMNWLFDAARKAGDSALLTDESGSAYYIAVFGSRSRNEYDTVNVRHILIQPESGEKAQDDDGYDAEQAQLKADAKTKAEGLLAQWKAGAATEDSFAELANANSSDTGSNTNGGLYEQIYKGQMVATFEDWCFADGRKTGDTGVVETDYGYHVMYFVGQDLPYWKVQVRSTLRQNDYSEWYTAKTEGYTAEKNSFGLKSVGLQ